MSTDETLMTIEEAQAAERLEPYFDRRADRIPTGAPDLDRVVARAGQRRRRRRAGAALATVAVVGLGAVGAVRAVDRDGQTVIDSASPPSSVAAPVASPLDWQLVRPRSGPGLTTLTATAAGATYRLSTAPGELEVKDEPGTLYRSADGVEWQTVDLPGGFATTALGGSSDRVYALGTVPAGRSFGVSLVSGGPSGGLGGATNLPIDIGALTAEAGSPVRLVASDVAVGHGHIVVSLTVQADFDALVRSRLPELNDSRWFQRSEDGTAIEVRRGRGDGGTSSGTVVPVAPTAAPTTAAPEAAAPGTVAPGAPAADGDPDAAKRAKVTDESVVESRYSWAELGITDGQRSFLDGRPYLFDSIDGTTFVPVGLPAGLSGRADVIVASDGYRLVSWSYDRTGVAVFRSADLASWTGPAALAGRHAAAGVVADHVVVVTSVDGGGPVVNREGAGGVWSQLDLGAAAGTSTSAWLDVAVGPMGIAAAAWTDDGSGRPGAPGVLVYSADGVTASSTPIPGESEGRPTALDSVTVGTDAVTVSLHLSDTEQPDGAPAMVLFVGVRR